MNTTDKSQDEGTTDLVFPIVLNTLLMLFGVAAIIAVMLLPAPKDDVMLLSLHLAAVTIGGIFPVAALIGFDKIRREVKAGSSASTEEHR